MGDTVCGKCSGNVSGKKVLVCSMCAGSYHSTCVEPFKECQVQQLQVLKYPGVLWYCDLCKPKMKQWVFAPKLEEKIDKSTLEMQKKLEHNTIEIQKICKILSDDLSQSRAFAEQTRLSCDRLAAQGERSGNISHQIAEELHKKADLEEAEARRYNSILYGLAETVHVEDFMLDTLYTLDFNSRVMKQTYRLGKADPSRTNPRPVKIVFETEIIKNQFMQSFNKWSKRGHCFVKPDLPKAVRDMEYKLRQERNILVSTNPGKKYRIRHGKIWEQSGNEWRELSRSTEEANNAAPLDLQTDTRSPKPNLHQRLGSSTSLLSAWSAPGAVGGTATN